ncbi:hypothetical protein HRI_003178500 [Hibiscus trionum]|uniref:CCHC-type domain-containing protein n=1 Tax=Hibiscus trionum TaxID=183268 RepID=A0A9W7IH70_HIBTR|nr:hypothetical protein HRI_003178500 [Hibiscus trionum]
MAANLHVMMANLRFTDKEKAALLESTPSDEVSMAADVKFGLVGKVITPRLISTNTFICVFPSIMADENMEIMALKPGIFLFKVPTELNLESLLRHGPWLFDGEPIAMTLFRPTLSLDEYRFDTMTWWIRVYGLPLDKMTMSMASKIGACFGELDHVDCRQINENLGDYFRVKVELNITQPLLRMVMLPNGEDGPRICPIQYEKLQKFCYFCGVLGHELKLCPQEVPKNEALLYGPWLCFPVETRMQKQRARRRIVAAWELEVQPRVPNAPTLLAPSDIPSSSTAAPSLPVQEVVNAPLPAAIGREGLTVGELDALGIDLPVLGDDPVKTAEIIFELLSDDVVPLAEEEVVAPPIVIETVEKVSDGKALPAEPCATWASRQWPKRSRTMQQGTRLLDKFICVRMKGRLRPRPRPPWIVVIVENRRWDRPRVSTRLLQNPLHRTTSRLGKSCTTGMAPARRAPMILW